MILIVTEHEFGPMNSVAFLCNTASPSKSKFAWHAGLFQKAPRKNHRMMEREGSYLSDFLLSLAFHWSRGVKYARNLGAVR